MSILDPFKKLFKKDEAKADFIADLMTFAYEEGDKNIIHFYDFEANKIPLTVEKINLLKDHDKLLLMLHCLSSLPCNNATKMYELFYDRSSISLQYYVNVLLFKYLLRKKLGITPELYLELVQSLQKRKHLNYYNTTFYSMSYLVKHLEHALQADAAISLKKTLIDETEKIILGFKNFEEKERAKLNQKFTNLRKAYGFIEANELFFLELKDKISKVVQEELSTLNHEQQVLWAEFLAYCQKSTGAKPSKKFETESKKMIQTIGVDHYKQHIHSIFNHLINIPEGELTTFSIYFNEQPKEVYLNSFNAVIIKGLIWSCAHFHDEKTLQLLYNLSLRSFKKVPNIGPESVLLGNACIYSLFKSKGLDGIGLLTRLRLKVKHNSTQATIQKYLAQAAESKGVSLSEIEDIATDNFKIEGDKRTFNLGDFTAEIRIVSIGKCELTWLKENGSVQKSVPAAVKENFATKLKQIKAIQKNIEQTLTAQRDRIDRLFRIDRMITKEHFQKYFVEHGLLGYIGKRLLWVASNKDEKATICWHQNAWQTIDGTKIELDKYSHFKLWHPAEASTNEVLEWRQFFIKHEIQQPLKQAFREVYLLTPAEINTRYYSNRMAAHILKQHQFVSLAKHRNWNASLEGSWEGGDNGTVSLHIPEFNIMAQYWKEGIYDDGQYNDAGILLYVTTDQIRFIDTRSKEPIDLIDVPTIVFSEVLRDTDLFVGVASIGNDPNWQDSGNEARMNTYWRNYSFGDLSEIAKNRREMLQIVLPKLKIASNCELTDKFLIVKGTIRTYKIHLGSTNILMEPNDQYLCIVQDRSSIKENKVFIPFDGDHGMSVIISKALLLAADDKITDQSILSQIKL